MPRVSRSAGPGSRERGAGVGDRRQHVEREDALGERRLLVAQVRAPRRAAIRRASCTQKPADEIDELLARRQPVRA